MSNCNWKKELMKLNPSDKEFPLTFCLTYMDNIKNKEEHLNKKLIEYYIKK
jgi:hypothetical protein